jgi:DNA processing protein
MDEASLTAWLTLQAIDGVGDRTLLKVSQALGSADTTLAATADELIRAGCNLELAESIRRGPDPNIRRQIDHQVKIVERLNIRTLTVFDPSYPSRLRTIPDPPSLLHMSGTFTPQDDVAIAIVGGRRATASGRILTEEIAKDLSECGVTIVSGLARGIDAAAHRGAMAGKGRTIAVLRCGIDRTYPSEHLIDAASPEASETRNQSRQREVMRDRLGNSDKHGVVHRGSINRNRGRSQRPGCVGGSERIVRPRVDALESVYAGA